MNSYQKLKQKCEYLQRIVDMFKHSLTLCHTQPKIVYDGSDETSYVKTLYEIYRNELDYNLKKQLQYWVAENLDEETIMKLLEMKKELKHD